jgi:ADP-ribosylation factor-like protein 2-binding protein
MMEEGFEAALSGFCRQHCHSFEDTKENKLEHMQLFHEYVSQLEEQLNARLSQRMPDFDMAAFKAWMQRQPADSIGSEMFDTLLAATDFEAFKQHMLSYKTEGAMASLQPDVRAVGAAPS